MKPKLYQQAQAAKLPVTHLAVAMPDIVEGWCRVEFKGRSERWCYAEMRVAFGVKMIHCEQPFEVQGTRFEFFNADAIFRLTIHSEERVRRELEKLEAKWADKNQEEEV
jgi:hypothetical protein